MAHCWFIDLPKMVRNLQFAKAKKGSFFFWPGQSASKSPPSDCPPFWSPSVLTSGMAAGILPCHNGDWTREQWWYGGIIGYVNNNWWYLRMVWIWKLGICLLLSPSKCGEHLEPAGLQVLKRALAKSRRRNFITWQGEVIQCSKWSKFIQKSEEFCLNSLQNSQSSSHFSVGPGWCPTIPIQCPVRWPQSQQNHQLAGKARLEHYFESYGDRNWPADRSRTAERALVFSGECWKVLFRLWGMSWMCRRSSETHRSFDWVKNSFTSTGFLICVMFPVSESF